MNPFLNTLLRFAISVSLQDRDEFVTKVAAFIEEKVGTDEEKARDIGEKILFALSTAKDQLELSQILSAIESKDKTLEGKIEELTKSIEELKESFNKQ